MKETFNLGPLSASDLQEIRGALMAQQGNYLDFLDHGMDPKNISREYSMAQNGLSRISRLIELVDRTLLSQ